ncbi:MAG TPA: NAD-dependent epimerase/dehydratase family protein, partial [Terriglobales bacterium]
MANPESTTGRLWTGKRVLVTGGSGFLGSHLVEHLVREGATVAALARTEGKLAAITPPPDYLFLRCDLTDEEQARRAIEGFAPQILYHFASHPDGRESFEQANAAIRGNLLATLNALEAFRRCGGQLFVYGDSCKVYGDCQVPYRASMPLKPTSSYAISKAAGWQLCELYRRQYGLACVSVRPTL